MAKKATTRKRNSNPATTSINPVAPVAPPQESVESVEGAPKKTRTKNMLPNAEGTKPARGLTWPFVEGSTLEHTFADLFCVVGKARYTVTRRQFAHPRDYYLYMAAKAEYAAEQYILHSGTVQKAKRTTTADLRNKVAQLEALLAQLQAEAE